MRLLFGLAGATLAGYVAVGAMACSTISTDPQQKLYAATLASIQALDQATLAADAAVKAGVLKGADAQKTLTGIQTARMGLAIANTIAAATAASGASK